MGIKTSHDSETPAHNQQILSACAFIHRERDGRRELFIAKRADTKKFLPGVYELPGGHIDFGEEMITGLKREIQEEFNMSLEVGDPFFAFTYTNPIKGSQTIEVVYFAQFIDDTDGITLNPEDHSSYQWVSEDNLEKVANSEKNLDDIEFKAIKKGFDLIRGKQLKF